MNNMKILLGLLSISTLSCKKSDNIVKNVNTVQIENKKDTVLDIKKDTTLILKDKLKAIQELNQIVPDTTINNKLLLSNYASLPEFYPKYKSIEAIERIRESPVIIFSDKFNIEYLIVYQYEGSTENSFDCFEIGYLKNEKALSKVNIYNTLEDSFKTETNLGLGVTFEEITSIKGSNYKKTEKEDLIIISYRNTNFETSTFLQRYNMPGYFMEFTLKENKVIKIKFGFDYP